MWPRHATIFAVRATSRTHDGSDADTADETDAIGSDCSHTGGSTKGFAAHEADAELGAVDTGDEGASVTNPVACAGICAIANTAVIHAM